MFLIRVKQGTVEINNFFLCPSWARVSRFLTIYVDTTSQLVIYTDVMQQDRLGVVTETSALVQFNSPGHRYAHRCYALCPAQSQPESLGRLPAISNKTIIHNTNRINPRYVRFPRAGKNLLGGRNRPLPLVRHLALKCHTTCDKFKFDFGYEFS